MKHSKFSALAPFTGFAAVSTRTTSHTFIHTSMALAVFTIAAALGGCATTKLEPASGAQQVSGLENAARESVQGVSVLVQDTEWPGSTPISQEVTPLRVAITNNSEQPLRIAYDKFSLVSPEGLISSALPLYEIDGKVHEPVAINQYSAIADPGFLHTNFAVAPYLGSVYPSVRSAALPFHYNQYYYTAQATQWEGVEMPTPAMRIAAIPEGVLESGGRVEGWLYFKEIEDAERIVFRADLANAETGSEIGEIRIPFDVE